jgi:hypothetical protein
MSKAEEIALSRLAQIGPSEAERMRLTEINRGIDATMRDVVADQLKGRAYDPWRGATSTIRDPATKITPAGAAPVRTPGERWVEPRPMASPEARATDEHIRRIADHFAPHAVASPLRAAEPEGLEALKATMARAQKLLDALEKEAAEQALAKGEERKAG